MALVRDGGGRLQEKRRFADARLPAEKNRRALREAFADRAVKLRDAGRNSLYGPVLG